MKTMGDYRDLFEDWMRRIKPFTSQLEEGGTLRTVIFINLEFEELYVESMRKDLLITSQVGNHDRRGKKTGTSYLILFSAEAGNEMEGVRNPAYWDRESSEKIVEWFAERYPGASPWKD